MNTPTRFCRISLAAAILALLTFNPLSSKAEPRPDASSDPQTQARQVDHLRAAKVEGQDRQDLDSQRFVVLEALIYGSLMIQYQRMDGIADLEYRSDKD
ncbi:MAG: hypothetical protein WBW55_13250 [Desulfobaccales bacterium]